MIVPVELDYERINYPDPKIVDLLEDDFIAEKIVKEWNESQKFLLETLAQEFKAKYNLSELYYYESDGIADFVRKVGEAEEQ